MKILYDYQAFTYQMFGGVSRYFAEIIDNLPCNITFEIAIKRSNNIYLNSKNLVANLLPDYDIETNFLPYIRSTRKKNLFKLLAKILPKHFPFSKYYNKIYAQGKLSNNSFDLFHATYYDPYFLTFLKGKPFVLTIHDMIDEIYGIGHYTPKRKLLLAHQATHIIAVSNQTKKDIVRILAINPEKISVIYHASALKVVSNDIALPDNYILFVGGRTQGYKNFHFFIETISEILSLFKDLGIVCVGSSFTTEEKKMFEDLQISERIHSINATEEELFTIYHNAKIFIFPSLYEGFGIPILEAFQAGCPVILSNSSCFPEIAGNAALYFEKNNQESLKEAIILMYMKKELRDKYIFLGTERLKAFSWEKAAKQTAEIYNKILIPKL
jgi:glycosyltransferase involved in cell wall biosynthesis